MLPNLRRSLRHALRTRTESIRYLSVISRALRATASPVDQSVLNLPLPGWDRGGRKKHESLTPLYASMRKLIDNNPGCVCLIQVGSFYELYFEQAEDYGPKLNLKVAQRKTSNYMIPMAGFPLFQLQKFVKNLVQDLEVSVAIIDQFGTKNNDNIIHRKISRIISPGTLVDETFLNYSQNNYLAAIHLPLNCTNVVADVDMPVGISWIDISVGDFYVQQTTLGHLMTDIARINPSEIILLKEYQAANLTDGAWYSPLLQLKKFFIRYHKRVHNDLKLQFKSSPQATRKTLELFSAREEAAMNMVLSYISVNIPETDLCIDVPLQYFNEKCLQMDPRTREALELTERSYAGHKSVVGSLFTIIRRTVTASGTRLLTQWIKSPLLDTNEIKHRQDFVQLFQDNNLVRVHLRAQLSKLGDFVRSTQHLSFGTGNTVAQLQAVSEGLLKVQEISDSLESHASESPPLRTFLKEFDIPVDIANVIQDTLHIEYEPERETSRTDDFDFGDTGSYSNTDIEKYRDIQSEPTFLFSIKRDYNEQLESLHDELDNLKLQEKLMLEKVKNDFSLESKITVSKKTQHGRFSNVIYISGRQKLIELICDKLGDDVRDKRKGSLLYKPAKWSRLQHQISEVNNTISCVEKEIIGNLRDRVLDCITKIRTVGKMADFLDVTSSFAVLAEETGLVCPKFVKSPQLKVSGGRHIVVESSLKNSGEMFIPNDTNLGPSSNLWVISGPNMGGKSTFLRQNALIVILAQIGSFVPAEKASIGIVDKIFTRIGASDDLFSDLSTFMVEMVETSNILKNATPRSLAIVDEIGRGTSGKEGLAIAYATLINLLKNNKCRTLFATHFGKELENLLSIEDVDQKKIKYFRTRVLNDDAGSELIIDHTLEPGISERSHAFEVAKMAGFPQKALDHAERALKLL